MSAPRRPPSSSGRRSRGGGSASERRPPHPPNESALATAARQTGMSEQEVLDLALARSAWKSLVAVRLMAPGASLEWSRTPLPALVNLETVRDARAFDGLDKGRLLGNDAAPTALERANGNWGPAVRRLCDAQATPAATITSLAAHTIALLSDQSRQVNCLVEMAPSAPSSRPPRHGVSSTASQAGENDQTNVATKRSFQAFSTYPTLTRSRRRRIAPSDPSLNQPSRQSRAECLERPNSSKTFTNLNNSLNREPNE